MAVSITLSGIDQAISDLDYKNRSSLKCRMISLIRDRYSTEPEIGSTPPIAADELVKALWETGNDPQAIRAKRKNFHTVKSAIITDLKTLYREGKNPEGITIGPDNTFVMSDEAKDKFLKEFAYDVKNDGTLSLGGLRNLLQELNETLADPERFQDMEGSRDEAVLGDIGNLIADLSKSIKTSDPDTMAQASEGQSSGQGTGGMDGNNGVSGGNATKAGLGDGPAGPDSDQMPSVDTSWAAGETETIGVLADPAIEDLEIDVAVEETGEIDELETEEFLEKDDLTVKTETGAGEATKDAGDGADQGAGGGEAVGDGDEFDDTEIIDDAGLLDKPETEDINALEDTEIVEEDDLLDDFETEEVDDLDAEDVLEEDNIVGETEAGVGEATEGAGNETGQGFDPADAGEEIDDLQNVDLLEEDELIEEAGAGVGEPADDGGVESGQGNNTGEATAEIDNLETEDLQEDSNLLEEDDFLEEPEAEEIEDFGDTEIIEEAGTLEPTAKGEEIGLPVDSLGSENSEGLEGSLKKRKLLAEEFDGFLGTIDRYYNHYVLIPGGDYPVGGKTTTGLSNPEHVIRLSSFFMGRFPVTNALFEIFVDKTGYRTTAEKRGYGTVYWGRFQKTKDGKTGLLSSTWNASVISKPVEGACWYQPFGPGSTLHSKRNHPVVQVSLEDAAAFAAWTGKRLPTEEEWEAAARTAKGHALPWGTSWEQGACNLESSGICDTAPVDRFSAYENEFGIVDVLGNVLEFAIGSESAGSDAKGKKQVFGKGGAWIYGNEVRLFSRFELDPESPSNILGFRCVAY